MGAEPGGGRDAAYAHLLGLDDPISHLVAEQGEIDFYQPTMSVDLPDPLSALSLHITGQLISRFAAFAIFNRLKDLLGGAIDARVLAATSEDALRDVGLTYAKARALRGLAEQVQTGVLDFDALRALDDDQAFRRLVQLRGVGPWSAQVFMLRTQRRPDIFPAGDIALRKAIAAIDGLPDTPTANAAAERAVAWRPYRSYAAGYLWRSAAAGARATTRTKRPV